MNLPLDLAASDATAHPVRRERDFCADPESLEGIPGWDIHCLQVSRGALAGRSVDLHLPAVQLLFEEYRNVVTNQFGCAPPGSISLGIAVSMKSEGLLNGTRWGDGLSAFDTRHELDSIVWPTRLISVVVDRRLLAEYLWDTEHADIEHWLSDGPAVANDAPLAAGLAERLSGLADSCAVLGDAIGTPAVAHRLRDSVLALLGPHIVDRLSVTAPSRPEGSHVEVVRRARELVSAHQDDPPSIRELCLALGVSRRWLQLSFNAVLQMSPLAYLRAMRLDRARRMLASGATGVQVKNAVEAYGFWHLSRFSRDYRDLFGELPSETLQRARART
ncbi:MAG TPA: helix-turn-helix domain-containing protein [Aromatoleum sp.]|uniref:helix-turn-helix domain-containing protein n=1 Tax=Aromatoleum sp. TaxID=2307007 RepID=UPI002B48643A|nr:helix-turn-helix domain-containing protein [Aromatoleum sp.]HJV25282.1 helix-turn-helix domain-containing protein [Aromatoleum sp.]